MATIQRMCEDSSEQLDNTQGFCISGMSVGHSVFNIEQVAAVESSPVVDNSSVSEAHGTLGEDAANNLENTEDRNEPHSPRLQETSESLNNTSESVDKNHQDDNGRDKESNDSEDGQVDEEDVTDKGDEMDVPDCPDYQNAKSSSGCDSNGSENLRTLRSEAVETCTGFSEGNNWGLNQANVNAEKGDDYQAVQEESQMTDLLNNFEILQKNENIPCGQLAVVGDENSGVHISLEQGKRDENRFAAGLKLCNQVVDVIDEPEENLDLTVSREESKRDENRFGAALNLCGQLGVVRDEPEEKSYLDISEENTKRDEDRFGVALNPCGQLGVVRDDPEEKSYQDISVENMKRDEDNFGAALNLCGQLPVVGDEPEENSGLNVCLEDSKSDENRFGATLNLSSQLAEVNNEPEENSGMHISVEDGKREESRFGAALNLCGQVNDEPEENSGVHISVEDGKREENRFGAGLNLCDQVVDVSDEPEENPGLNVSPEEIKRDENRFGAGLKLCDQVAVVEDEPEENSDLNMPLEDSKSDENRFGAALELCNQVVEKREENLNREDSKQDENSFGAVSRPCDENKDQHTKVENTISHMKKIMVKTLDQINAQVLKVTQGAGENCEALKKPEGITADSVDDESSEIIVLDVDQSEAMETDKEENSHQSECSESSQQIAEIPQSNDVEKAAKNREEISTPDMIENPEEKLTEASETFTTYSEAAEEDDSKSSHVESESSCVEKQTLEEESIMVVDEKSPGDKMRRGRPKSAAIGQRPRIPPIRIKCADLEAKAAKIKQAAALQNSPDSRRRQYHRRCKPSVIIDGDDSPDDSMINIERNTFPTVPPSTLKRKYESSVNVSAAKRPRSSGLDDVEKPARPQVQPVDDRLANSLLEKLQRSVGSALSITIKKKKPIPAETLNALEQLKNMSEISTTKISRSEMQAARPSFRKTPTPTKKAPAPAMDLPIITSVISSKNENGAFFNVASRGKTRHSGPAGRKNARSCPNSIPYVVID